MSNEICGHVSLKWTTSRAADTYGYRIATLRDEQIHKAFKTCGGGYSLIGTVLGDWLEYRFQNRIAAVAVVTPKLYGLWVNPEGAAIIDGAVGVTSVIKIAKAAGISIREVCNSRGAVVAFDWQIEEVSA